MPRPTPDRLLFPLAAAYAVIYVPLWRVAGVHGPAWHGHELLFGFALAVVAGFLTTRPRRLTTAALAGTWLLGRAAMLLPAGPVSALLGLSFPAALLIAALAPLVRGAKRWENRIVPAVVVLLAALDVLWWIGMSAEADGPLARRALLAAVDAYALLLLIVGGRVLPAAVGGWLERRGVPRRDHARSAYELPLAGVMLLTLAADLAGYGAVAGAGCVAAAAVTLVRVTAWQLWRTWRRAALWALALGYLWLIAGLALKGAAQLGAGPPVTHALHGITVGGLGTITLVMMARTRALRQRRPLEPFADMGVAAVALSAAAVLRLLAAGADAGAGWLLPASAGLWALAFALLLARLGRAALRSQG